MRSVPAGPAVPPAEVGALTYARDRNGHSPRRWLAASLGAAGPLLEVRRPPGRSDDVLELRVGITLVSRHGRLPLRTDSVAAVALDMCLPSVPELDTLFAELRRALRPAGTVAVLVPGPIRSLAELRAWWPLHRALGGRPRFRHESARDHLHWLLTAADFAVMADDRRTFWLAVPDGQSAARVPSGLVVDGVWPPDITTNRLDLACAALIRYAAPGRALPIPLRLLVARR